MKRISSIAAFSVATALLCAQSVFAGAAASIKIEQLSPKSYGSWTMLAADGSSRTSKDKGVDVKGGYTVGITDYGQNTLSVTPPPGMSAKIAVYRGNEFITEVTTQQYSFEVHANDNYRFLITYSFTKLGSLGVTSDPSALRFRMKGPSGRMYTAKTPFTFKSLPSGKYSLYFPRTDTCLQPPVKTIDVEPDQRNTTMVTLTCNVQEEEAVDTSRISKRSIREYVEQRELKSRGERK
jgi:hypothetical protein